MRAIIVICSPQECCRILNGDQSLLVRKTCPEIFKRLKSYEGAKPIEVYIYCTNDKPYLTYYRGACRNEYITHNDKRGLPLNGKVVAKFTLNRVEEITENDIGNFITKTLNLKELCKKSCLSEVDLDNYFQYLKLDDNLGWVAGYAWHIDNLEIFDKPKELSEFNYCDRNASCECCYYSKNRMIPYTKFDDCKSLKHIKAPQSRCYMEV